MLCGVQGVSFAGPAACMLTCGVLTPAAVSSQLITGTLVALLSVAFACGSWARAGLYCNHQVRPETHLVPLLVVVYVPVVASWHQLWDAQLDVQDLHSLSLLVCAGQAAC